jgi:hypothetical protein
VGFASLSPPYVAYVVTTGHSCSKNGVASLAYDPVVHAEFERGRMDCRVEPGRPVLATLASRRLEKSSGLSFASHGGHKSAPQLRQKRLAGAGFVREPASC